MTRTNLQNLINSNLADFSNILPIKHREVETALLNEIAPLYEVKELDIPDAQLATFLTANFDLTGLGINNYTGFAICNGSNGTRNRGGRTSIGYDTTNYATIGATGGNKDAVVVSHSHTAITNANIVLGSGDAKDITIDGVVSATTGSPITATVNTEGVSGTDKNMQPYIVTLFIQRIA